MRWRPTTSKKSLSPGGAAKLLDLTPGGVRALNPAKQIWPRKIAIEMSDTPMIVPTGVPSLDVILAGGIPDTQSVIVTGDPGTGKTILSSQIAFAQARKGRRVVLATVTSESHAKLIHELKGFSFFDRQLVGDEIFVVSAYPWLQKGPKDAKDALIKTVKERKAKLLFIDGLRSIRDLWQDESKMRDFLYEMNVALAVNGAIGLFTTEYPLEKLLDFPEATTVDGIIALSTKRLGERIVRRAQVAKLRGRPHLTGQHVMHISVDGVAITPRLESITTPSQTFHPPEERLGFGLLELDKLLYGGIYRQTTTIVAGGTGIGKTILSLYFVANGAQQNEKSLLVSLTEAPPRLVQRTKRIGLDLEPHVKSGNLVLKFLPALEAEADDLAVRILQWVSEVKAKRLVIDGLAHLEQSLACYGERSRPFLLSLIARLREAEVTTLFVKEVNKIAGPELDFSDLPISILAENLILLRHVELHGRLHRILSILKMHDSASDPNLREFEITAEGLRVLEPVQTAEGLLTGIARPVGTEAREGFKTP